MTWIRELSLGTAQGARGGNLELTVSLLHPPRRRILQEGGFSGLRQQDAHEMLRVLLNALSNECDRVRSLIQGSFSQNCASQKPGP